MNYFLITQQFSHNNIRKYFSFAVRCALCVTLYFIYTPFFCNEDILLLKNSDMINIIRGSLSFIIVTLSFYTIYSFYSYIRTRTNEFKTLLMLGLTKKEMLKLIAFEQFYLICICLIIGMLLGTIFSKLFFIIIIKYIGLENVKFSLSGLSYAYTASFAILIYLIILERNVFIIRKLELIKSNTKADISRKTRNIIMIVGLIVLSALEVYNIVYLDESIIRKYVFITITSLLSLYLYIFYFNKAAMYILSIIDETKKQHTFSFSMFLRNIEKNRFFLFFTISVIYIFLTYDFSSELFFFYMNASSTVKKTIICISMFSYLLYFTMLSQVLFLKIQIKLMEGKANYDNMYVIGFTREEIIRTIDKRLKLEFFTPIILAIIMFAFFIGYMVISIGFVSFNIFGVLISILVYSLGYIRTRKYLNRIFIN